MRDEISIAYSVFFKHNCHDNPINTMVIGEEIPRQTQGGWRPSLAMGKIFMSGCTLVARENPR
jgi:hypothetical protein